jgi:serine/threonine protein phosphatase PrpC
MTNEAQAATGELAERTSASCPNCGASVSADQSFCEACGFELSPTEPAPTSTAAELESPITLSRSIRAPLDTEAEPAVVGPRPCQTCGGTVGAEGYCETCGTKAASLRDHYTEQPSSWVAACCDRGIRHHRNEDATAVASKPEPGSRAVLVVCDGVSTSQDSDVASLAGARAARDALVAQQPAGLGLLASRAGALAGTIEAATALANAAVIDNTDTASENAASCTFAAAVIEGDLIVFGNVGDSRVYWVPDLGQAEAAQELSLDDSVAQFRISAGVPREQAENGPQAHAITKWLGRDSPDFKPRTGSITVAAPGWLLVCSDGLWNYVSEAAAIQRLIGDLTAKAGEPLPLAEALVDWANAQGGKDNISVALARHVGGPPSVPTPRDLRRS